jgi:hypothetical protein
MILHRHRRASLYALAIASIMMGCCSPLSAQQKAALVVAADAIGGKVTGAKGPEAGVWVIAETTDLPTKYAKMVVTNDLGARLRAGRFRQAGRCPRQDHQSHGKARAERSGGRGILSGHVLVFHAQDSRRRRISGLGQEPERHPGRHGFASHLDR